MPLSRSALCLLLFASLARADTTVEFTVAAGKHDRKNEPVRVPLKLSAAPTDLAVVQIKDDKDKVVAQGQLTNPDLLTDKIKAGKDQHRLDLVFVLPSLKANETATLK